MDEKLELILAYVPDAERYTFDEAYNLALRWDQWAADAFEISAKDAGLVAKS